MSLLQNLTGKSFQDVFSGGRRLTVSTEVIGPITKSTILEAGELDFITLNGYTVSTSDATIFQIWLGDVVIDRLYMGTNTTQNVIKPWQNSPTGLKGANLKISSTGSGTVFVSACVVMDKKAPISAT